MSTTVKTLLIVMLILATFGVGYFFLSGKN